MITDRQYIKDVIKSIVQKLPEGKMKADRQMYFRPHLKLL